VKKPASLEEKNKTRGKEDLAFEFVSDESLSNEQADQLATLFAQALVRKLLRKGIKNGHSRSKHKG
jgi:hypothetical protein